MADEIQVSVKFKISKGNLFLDTGTVSDTYDMAGTKRYSNTQIIGTTHEAISIAADIVNYGYCYVRNLDATNYCEIGLVVSATFYPFSKLYAGQFMLLPLTTSAVTYYAKANTANIDLDISVGEL